MLNIAICDDNIAFCSELETNIIKCLKSEKELCEIDIYYNGENFIKQITSICKYDIIFLDIELVSTTGIEVGKYIREVLGNEEVYIAFISSKTNYAMQLFQVRPVDFLVKPIEYNQLKILLHLLLKLTNKDKSFFEYKVGHSYEKIPLKEIMYFESNDKKIIIHCINGSTLCFYGKLNDIAEKLKCKRFLHIHKSYLINYEYTLAFNYNTVSLINKITLPISQSRRAIIRQAHLHIREEL